MAILCKKKLLIKEPKNTQINNYIVVHNSNGIAIERQYSKYEKNIKDDKAERTHYLLDDKTIYQILKDNDSACHTSGDGVYSTTGGTPYPG